MKCDQREHCIFYNTRPDYPILKGGFREGFCDSEEFSKNPDCPEYSRLKKEENLCKIIDECNKGLRKLIIETKPTKHL